MSSIRTLTTCGICDLREILQGQRPDGSWADDVGMTYATAMACVVLQMPCEWLPIFQK